MTQRELERMETAHRIGQGVDKEKSKYSGHFMIRYKRVWQVFG